MTTEARAQMLTRSRPPRRNTLPAPFVYPALHATEPPRTGITLDGDGAGEKEPRESLDRLWLALRTCDERATTGDLTREIAFALDREGANLEAATQHLARCVERGETHRVAILVRAHRHGVQRLRDLVLDLLDATADGGAAGAIEAVDLEDAIEAALALLGQAGERLRHRLRLPPAVPRIRGRRAEIVRALFGVLDAAIRASGSRRLVDVEVGVAQERVVVRVTDGEGGPATTRLERSRALSFVERAISRSGGTFEVEEAEASAVRVVVSWRRTDAR